MSDNPNDKTFELPPPGDAPPAPPPPESPLKLGEAVLVRCVTHYYTGRIVALTAEAIILDDACWIANTGRFNAALASGKLEEVEPFPDPVFMARGAVVDITKWRHALPRSVLPAST